MKSQQDFKREEDQNVLGSGEAGPVRTEAPGLRENRKCQCDVNQGTLVHSIAAWRRDEHTWSWAQAGAALGTDCCPPLESGRALCPPSEWGQVLRAPYVRRGPQDHSCRRRRAAEGSLCSPPRSFSLGDSYTLPDLRMPLTTVLCLSPLGSCGCFYPEGLVLPTGLLNKYGK